MKCILEDKQESHMCLCHEKEGRERAIFLNTKELKTICCVLETICRVVLLGKKSALERGKGVL